MQELFLNFLGFLPLVVFFLIVWAVIKVVNPGKVKIETEQKVEPVIEPKEPVVEWFEKIALLIDMGELEIEKIKNDRYGMVVISSNEEPELLKLFSAPNWWNVPERHVAKMGTLDAELKIILDGESLRAKHTQPIHKFLAAQSSGIVDEMLNKAIQNHGV
jgi:hypothetical protein